MIKSMTGYGRARETVDGRTITVELKSVNHRYFDCSVKAPRIYGFLEDALKSRLQNAVSRGKLDIYVSVDQPESGNVNITLNRPVLEAYIALFRQIEEQYSLKNDLSLSALTGFSDIFNIEKAEEDSEKITGDVISVLELALSEYNRMREIEGARLGEDIRLRTDEIARMLGEVEIRSPKTVAEYRSKLEQRIREILSGAEVDDTRLLTEAAIFADKVAVAEECVRLRSHIAQLYSMLQDPKPVGRKLDFLVQEFNRETNTIGSKANDSEIAMLIVAMKAEIEKIREQVQNIE